jgi:hypothetical protein
MMRPARPTLVVIAAAVVALGLAASPARAQLDRLLQGLGVGSSSLSDAKIGEGLKEALKVGTENTVNLTGKTDGFFANQAIKILMPEKLRTVETGLRAVGYGPKVDEFVLSMTRARSGAGRTMPPLSTSATRPAASSPPPSRRWSTRPWARRA